MPKRHPLVKYFTDEKAGERDPKLTDLSQKLGQLYQNREKDSKTNPEFYAKVDTLINYIWQFGESLEYYKTNRDPQVLKRVNDHAELLQEQAGLVFNDKEAESLKEKFGVGKDNLEFNLIADGKPLNAATYIERKQAEIAASDKVSAKDIACIFAARIIANSDRGSKSKLVKTEIDPEKVNALAEKMALNDHFIDFMNNTPLTMDEITHGHGGKVEDKFAEYFRNVEKKSDIDRKLFSRFIDKKMYLSYNDYINKNRRDFEKEAQAPGASLDAIMFEDPDGGDIVHASKMAAAFALSGTGQEFSEAELNRKAESYRNDSFFKLSMKDENLKKAANLGETFKFTTAAMQKKTQMHGACELKIKNIDEMKAALKALKYGNDEYVKNNEKAIELLKDRMQPPYDKEADNENYAARIRELEKKNEEYMKKKVAGRSPEYRKMVKAAENFIKKGENADYVDLAEVIDTVIDYQSDKMGGSVFPSRNERFENSMKLLGSAVSGTTLETYLNQQVLKKNEARGIGKMNPNYSKASDYITAPEKEKMPIVDDASEIGENRTEEKGEEEEYPSLLDDSSFLA
ncbi:MAG: hypothetical protein IKN24_09875 [Lachnospiraceae bacterium]|nr:hypothetical protein [Lachnospiraceae bacterium]